MDCASRGILASEIINHNLWWHGPPWLALPDEEWPRTKPPPPIDASLEEKSVALHTNAPSESWDLSQRYSSWPKLLRITAYIMRFVAHYRKKISRDSDTLLSGLSLASSEIASAKIVWIRCIQNFAFGKKYTPCRPSKNFHLGALFCLSVVSRSRRTAARRGATEQRTRVLLYSPPYSPRFAPARETDYLTYAFTSLACRAPAHS